MYDRLAYVDVSATQLGELAEAECTQRWTGGLCFASAPVVSVALRRIPASARLGRSAA
jgi:hypothetical protein